MQGAHYARTLSSQLLQDIQVTIEDVCHIGIDKRKVRTTMHTGPNAICGCLTEGGRMLSPAAGASHHAFIGLVCGCRCLLPGYYLTYGDAGSNSYGCKQKRKSTRDRCTEQNNLNPHPICFHGQPSPPAQRGSYGCFTTSKRWLPQ
jgi:hypothetical protein